ncbi:hypothetical protein ABMA27_003163 [Loxostege sticticalis]|uniref:Potassium channel domain-containing protein n=1 Tax=Loxostege sticticalis TaxID=481309 RepID=A0ABR3HS96_LOXSC
MKKSLHDKFKENANFVKPLYRKIKFGNRITPLSPKWRHAIEKRIESERQLTMLAMARGAKLHPGQFWNLSGTFLFSIYVMTALGFGAPVPQTTWGRTAALLYAVLAVPTHIFLMLNASTCVVATIESCLRTRNKKKPDNHSKAAIDTGESPNYSRNSEVMKTESGKVFILRRKIGRFLGLLCFGRCIPVATVAYYAFGAIAFGALRGRQPLETILFPLEFSTTGGLELVDEYVRILYGFYVEGAMALLACALATMRSHGSTTINYMSEKYRLFTINKQQ